MCSSDLNAGPAADIAIDVTQVGGNMTINALPASQALIRLAAPDGQVITNSNVDTIGGLSLAAQSLNINRPISTLQGDITLVVRAILNANWLAVAPAKFKRPFHYLVSTLRSTAAQTTALSTFEARLNELGQPLFLFETPDGYPDTVEYWSGNIMPTPLTSNSRAAFMTAPLVPELTNPV